MVNELIQRPTAARLASTYKKAINDMERAFESINEAKKTLKSAYGDTTSFFPFEFNQWKLDKIKKEITRSCWKRKITMLELPSFMTSKRLDKLWNEIDNDKTPEITEQSITDFCNNVYAGLNGIFDELMDEAYRWLHPYRDKFKTNKKFETGEKVIINGSVITVKIAENTYITYISAYAEKKIQTLDTVFHLLDGKKVVKYPGNALTIIKQAIQDKKWQCSSKYFNFKWYKKGTLHIQFKRLDLLKEFNKRAGKNRLKSQDEDF
ncbi:MAG TPA: DUF4942 domain-containing protein [Desulfobacteraceae bacterium]|nr:DUF4942 domain-containing protein [Desulfobacteraceae bacterium]